MIIEARRCNVPKRLHKEINDIRSTVAQTTKQVWWDFQKLTPANPLHRRNSSCHSVNFILMTRRSDKINGVYMKKGKRRVQPMEKNVNFTNTFAFVCMQESNKLVYSPPLCWAYSVGTEGRPWASRRASVHIPPADTHSTEPFLASRHFAVLSLSVSTAAPGCDEAIPTISASRP